MADVFISYASEDRDRARTLATALEARGWSVWWDRKIIAGQAFDQIIERELDTAKSVVVLWSKDSIASEWVKNEAAVAAERGILVPALIDAVKLPLEFRRKQAADLVGWDGNASHEGFQTLCDGIAASAATARVVPHPSPSPPRPGARWSRRWTWGAIASAAVVLGLGAYWVLIVARHQAPPSAPLTNPAGEAAIESYPMICRGGGRLAVARDASSGVRISFQPAPGPASAGLAPGQCTWSDRALRPGEPTTICDSNARAAQYVGLLAQSDQYVTVHVYNDNRGCMRLTRFGS